MESANQRKKPRPIRRRVFLGQVAKKAAYVAPAVLALKAARTATAGPSGCGQTGSPCTTDADCCAGFTCQTGNMPCAGMANCMCELP